MEDRLQRVEQARSLLDLGLPPPSLHSLFASAPGDLVEAAVSVARSLGHEQLRVALLAGAAPWLSADRRQGLIGEALETARGIEDRTARARALTSVAAGTDGPQRAHALAEALAAILVVEDPARAALLRQLAWTIERDHSAADGERYLRREVVPDLPDRLQPAAGAALDALFAPYPGADAGGVEPGPDWLVGLTDEARMEVLEHVLLELSPRRMAANGGDHTGSPPPEDAPPAEDAPPMARPRRRMRGGPEPQGAGPMAEPGSEPQLESPQAEPRWLSAIVRDESGEKLPRAFHAGAINYVGVDIGPFRKEAGRLTATGPEAVDATLQPGQTHDLVIVFEIADLHVFSTQPLSLPPTGASSAVVFPFRAPAQGSPVTAKVTALHENRVLQAAELRGVAFDDPAAAPAGFALDFKLASIRPGLGDLGFRAPFDAAVLGGHLGDGRPVATSVAGLNVARFEDEALSKAATRIISLLTDLADHPERFTDGLASEAAQGLMRQLAYEGRALHDVLGKGILEQVAQDADLSRLQVVSDPEDFIPVEFIYDAPVPAEDAGLCPNWQNALRDGTCPSENHPVDDVTGLSSVVCPSGFWAITKVVERQVVAEQRSRLALEQADFAIVAGPTAERPHLRAFASGLFAASSKIRAEDAASVLEALSRVTGGKSTRVTTWPDWIRRVAADDPALLVLLSHSTRSGGAIALEIEDAARFPLVGIKSTFVTARPDRPPVVLLLGCETATADKDLQSFVGRIKESGAALVVGTIAPVLGRHAAPVATALIHGLHEAAAEASADRTGVGDAGPGTFGDLMLRLRRRMLADGHLMALCLTSFGDADWQLAPAA